MNVDGGQHHPELGLVQLGNLVEDEAEEGRPTLLLRLGRDGQEVEQQPGDQQKPDVVNNP